MNAELGNIIPSIDYFIERKCLPAWTIPESIIDFHDLTLVVSGEATYIVDGMTHIIKKGSVIYIPGGCKRYAFTNPDRPMHCFAFNFQYFCLNSVFTALPFPTVFDIGNPDSELLELYTDFNRLWLDKSDGYMLKARALFMLILHKLLRCAVSRGMPPEADIRIEKIKEYILDHYQEKIEMQAIADITGLNPVYLGAFFKKHAGMTVNEYTTRVRIRKARDLLSTGGYNVSEAAYRCGFNDISHFSRTFRKFTGLLPSSLLKGGV